MRIRITTNADKVATEFVTRKSLATGAFNSVVMKNGQELMDLVKLGASGWRGGPEVITGRYRDSIRSEMLANTSFTEVEVGTDEPYGYLLELGGIVPDQRGGENTVAPHPHWENAIDYLEPDFLSDLNATLDTLLK
jgi:hypothetical protein